MNFKGFISVNLLIAVFLIGGISFIAEAEASDDSVVIGLSYNSENSLNLGIREKDTVQVAFKYIDWYIYGTGSAIYFDGDKEEIIELDGVTLFRTEYNPGENVSVSFDINDVVYKFELKIQSSTYSIKFVDTEDMIEIGSLELSQRDLRNILTGAAVIFFGFMVGLHLAKRRAKTGEEQL